MPELPEVETTRRGISHFLVNQVITQVNVRHRQLRFPIPALESLCTGQIIQAISRRGKYLLLELTTGYLLIHLGMSGHLRIAPAGNAAGKHDHIDLLLDNQRILRYNDPRRFGLWLYLTDDPFLHPLLAQLGPEPLSKSFSAIYLSNLAKGKKKAIKSFIMDSKVVVGVGNIYASESLFWAGIHPQTPANRLSMKQYTALVKQIKTVLRQAIEAGGTTLRDFHAHDGKPGYFINQLQVYGRKNLPCARCQTPIQVMIIGGRNSAFCPVCQIIGD